MSQVSHAVLRLHPADNVVVALADLAPGTDIASERVRLVDPIGAGHKIAVRAIAAGEPILKYSQLIGLARGAIAPGQHVHTHNVELPQEGSARGSRRNPGDAVRREQHAGAGAIASERHFMGFRRADGRAATRNYIGIITTVNCSATVARRAAEYFSKEKLAASPGIDGVVALRHTSGCSAALGASYEVLQRTLAGFARHPNFGGVLLLGLGCEDNHVRALVEEQKLALGDRVRALSIQDAGGTERAIAAAVEAVKELIALAADAKRVAIPVAELTLALQCGGSDAYSGISANPALGVAADLLVRHGGAVVLSETPEIYGAEHLLLDRAADEEVAQRLRELLGWWQRYAARHDVTLDDNPAYGNKEGGLTTIFEKSLGAVAKAGTSTLTAVYDYAQPISQRGFCFMDSPGNDPVSVTGQVASGCNVICFTTGRGSVFGCKPAPSLKLATNTPMYTRMQEDMDINCGRVVDGTASLAEVGHEIFERVIATASGERTRSELLGFGDEEFSPWSMGLVL